MKLGDERITIGCGSFPKEDIKRVFTRRHARYGKKILEWKPDGTLKVWMNTYDKKRWPNSAVLTFTKKEVQRIRKWANRRTNG